MSNLEAAETRLSFVDILEAVQDSKRGRWFLQEFESRIQKRDTQSVLQAISRLETRMESMGAQTGTTDDLAKVRSAIANARHDLLKLDLGKDGLSKEGRLFAELAEMARKAMPVAVDSNAGIVRTLQLVDEIDRAITAPNTDAGAKFFSADANLFERPAPVAKPVLVATVEPAVETAEPMIKTAFVKKEDAVATGAKLVIRKVSQSAEPEVKVEAETLPTRIEQLSPVTADLPVIDNPRIVIIRRKAEDMPDVSVGEAANQVSAA
jgi:hypothetical protein